MNPSVDPMPCHISIVIPTRNRASLLARALDGVRAQHYQAYEVIAIDDGSEADERAAYEALFAGHDPRFRLIRLGGAGEYGIGPSVARNHGIAQARGEILAFCDDDDFWTDPDHLAMMAETFAARPHVDLYIASQQAVEADGRVSRAEWLPALTRLAQGAQRAAHGHLVTVGQLCRAGGFAQLNILAVRTALARAVDGFWVKVAYEEDRDFFWRAADRAREIAYNPRVIGQHNVPDKSRQQNQSTSFSSVERWMLSALVSQHIAMHVRHPAIGRLCRSYEGDMLRRVALHFAGDGRPELGLQYAQRAFAARGSLKWLGYMAVLGCRSLFSRRAAT
jgi:glycosyltransferase involved in cell wall biosynthesis